MFRSDGPRNEGAIGVDAICEMNLEPGSGGWCDDKVCFRGFRVQFCSRVRKCIVPATSS